MFGIEQWWMFNVPKTLTTLDILHVPIAVVLKHLSACWIGCQILASLSTKAIDSNSKCTRWRFFFYCPFQFYTNCSHSIFPHDLRHLLRQQQSWRITLFTGYLLFQWALSIHSYSFVDLTVPFYSLNSFSRFLFILFFAWFPSVLSVSHRISDYSFFISWIRRKAKVEEELGAFYFCIFLFASHCTCITTTAATKFFVLTLGKYAIGYTRSK